MVLNELDRKILEIILAAEESVSSKELARKCDVAINTIRNEIRLINTDAASHGFQIMSKASKGHYIEIIDPKLALSHLNRLRYHLKRNRFAEVTYPPQVYYLTRRFLSAGQGLTLERLCQELYCSKTVLMKDLRQVKAILSDYDLTLKKKRGGQGLFVAGNEWNIRQCLIAQHKIYHIFFEEHSVSEAEFESQFLMQYGEEYTSDMRKKIDACLSEQRDFTIPMMHIPKIMNGVCLSIARAKRRDAMSFTAEQVARAKDTPEYRTAYEIHTRLNPHVGEKIYEADVLATAMLLLSYETQNHRLKETEEYKEHAAVLDELLKNLQTLRPSLVFDEEFEKDFICHLYVLRNRRAFHVFADPEQTGGVRRNGLMSADLCLQFARFYRRKYGVVLHRQNTIKAFYCFNRLLKQEKLPYFYAQDILVISRYGIDCARSMATVIRISYGPKVRRVTACEFLERPDDMEEYNLLVTDSGEFHLGIYGLPVITMDFSPGDSRIPELDRYLEEIRVYGEQLLIGEDSFYRVELCSKEAVFGFVADQMAERGYDRAEILTHLRENDVLINQERGDGFVLLPILLENIPQQELFVVINRTPIHWNVDLAQAFVCYTHTGDQKRSDIRRSILSRFMEGSRDEVKDWAVGRVKPMDTLYPRES